MALTCARCGVQNPDGNLFCQACGTPLTAVAVGPPIAPPGMPAWTTAPPPSPPSTSIAPPLAAASPPPRPVAYASPYYSPVGAAPQPPVHRTPWVLILSAVVALIVVMAGCGTAIALISRAGNQTSGSGIETVPSPSPGVSPSPIASATTPSGPFASNAGETVPVPTGWSVANQDTESIILVDPNGTGVVTVGSGLSNPAQSAQQNKDSLDKYLAGKYPDTKDCPSSKTTTGALNGASGISWTKCFTLISGGQSVSAAAALFVGASADGSVYYVVMLVTSQDNLQRLIGESKPLLQGIQWKLK